MTGKSAKSALQRALARTMHLVVIASSTFGNVFALHAQQQTPPIRAVSAPIAISKSFSSMPDELREASVGKLLVNFTDDHQLLLLDSELKQIRVLADENGTGVSAYPRLGKLIPYFGDSTLFLESESRSFVLIDGDGKFGRVLAPPRPRDFNLMIGSGAAGVDLHGSIVYQGPRALGFPPPCRVEDVSVAGASAAPTSTPTDSVVIVRGNFETRVIDTLGRAKTIGAVEFPTTVTDGNCRILSAKIRVNPSAPATDAWVVTARGTVAIVRGHDYHVDFVDPDGTKRSGAKLPFDWRRNTDVDKQNRIDSARKIIDSVTALGGYRMKACGNMRTFYLTPPDSSGNASNMIQIGGSAGGGRGGASSAAQPVPCQSASVTPAFVALSEMADYLAPIREEAAKADMDGNVWILPTTSLSARGGLLYDVVDLNGAMVERVQLPADRDIAGFGRNGVLYLSHRTRGEGTAIEKVTVVR